MASSGGGVASGAKGTVQPGRDHWPRANSILLAGGGGGAIRGGWHLKYRKNTPLMNLYVRVLEIAGVDIEAAGDSTGPLKGLA